MVSRKKTSVSLLSMIPEFYIAGPVPKSQMFEVLEQAFVMTACDLADLSAWV